MSKTSQGFGTKKTVKYLDNSSSLEQTGASQPKLKLNQESTHGQSFSRGLNDEVNVGYIKLMNTAAGSFKQKQVLYN